MDIFVKWMPQGLWWTTVVLVLAACKNTDPVPTNSNTGNTTGTSLAKAIEVKVYHRYNIQYHIDSLLEGANVLVYKTEQDQLNGTNVYVNGTSDANGKYNLTNLATGTYYFHISKDTLEPAFEQATISENTSKAFVEAILQ